MGGLVVAEFGQTIHLELKPFSEITGSFLRNYLHKHQICAFKAGM